MKFPSIIQVLSNLDVTMSLLKYRQYETALVEKGIVYVNSVATVQRTFFTDIIGSQ